MNVGMIVNVQVRQSSEAEAYVIGTVVAPAWVTTQEEAESELSEKWAEWRDEVTAPDADSNFIDWLEKKTTWGKLEQPACTVTIET